MSVRRPMAAVSLARQTSSWFDGAVRSSGDRYVVEGRVTIESRSADHVEATVRGTSSYAVILTRELDELLVNCTCPLFEAKNLCTHIWAALRASDDAGCFSAVRRSRIVEVRGLRGDVESTAAGRRPAPASSEDAGPPVRQGAAGAVSGDRGSGAPRILWSRAFEHVQEAVRAAGGSRRRSAEIGYLVSAPLESAGDLLLHVIERSRLEGATRQTMKPLQVTHALVDREVDPAHRRILTVLLGCSGGTASWAAPRLVLSAPMREMLLPLMCRTGACFLRRSGEPPIQLSWDAGEPWELCLEVRRAEDDARCWELRGALRRAQASIDVVEPELVMPGGHVFLEGQVSELRDFDAFAWIDLLRQQGSLRIPVAEEEALLEKLFRMRRTPLLDLPPSLTVDDVGLAPRPVLRIDSPVRGHPVDGRLGASVRFDYDDLHVEEGEDGEHLADLPRRRMIRRDRSAEREALRLLPSLGFRDADIAPAGAERTGRRTLPVHLLPAAVHALVSAGWAVESDGKRHRTGRAPSLRIRGGTDEFELEGTFDFDGYAVPARDVLAALRRGEKTVALDDGTVGLLPEEWLEGYGLLAHLGLASSGDARRGPPEASPIRFVRSQVALVDALLEGQPEIAVDGDFARLRDGIRRFDRIAPVKTPQGFCGELRPYQREGLAWLQFLQGFKLGGCLADDMGLGKTVQVLALLVARKAQRRRGPARHARPSLVIAPRSVVFNWLDEAARFVPGLRILDHTGDRLPPGDHFDEHDLVITTYGTLRQEAELLARRHFDYAILDEGQIIKNASSGVARAACLLHADHRLVLSGTPIENHPGELWSLFEFLNPGMLGKASVLKLGTKQTRITDGPARAAFARALRPFLLRRTKAQVAADLPEKQEKILYCEMDRQQQDFYERLRLHYQEALLSRVRLEGLDRVKIHVLEALLRLRQAACHSGLVDPKRKTAGSVKLDALVEHLESLSAEGHKALVFSQFTSLLALVEERLRAAKMAYEYLDGSTPRREERVAHFQTDPACPVFLISLKAGGIGLNLTAADYVFLLDPWWNPAVEAQAIDRAHRIGQARPVIAYRLLCRGTVEEKIAGLQQQKRALAESLIDPDVGLVQSLTQEDLEILLS